MDTTANQVDRLRLLGNGVCPATASKAWIVLSSKLEAMAASQGHKTISAEQFGNNAGRCRPSGAG
tara:strand:- start:174 stop:368 length:195 start_codon:yes stop_codon:yes gene_type:complete